MIASSFHGDDDAASGAHDHEYDGKHGRAKQQQQHNNKRHHHSRRHYVFLCSLLRSEIVCSRYLFIMVGIFHPKQIKAHTIPARRPSYARNTRPSGATSFHRYRYRCVPMCAFASSDPKHLFSLCIVFLLPWLLAFFLYFRRGNEQLAWPKFPFDIRP